MSRVCRAPWGDTRAPWGSRSAFCNGWKCWDPPWAVLWLVFLGAPWVGAGAGGSSPRDRGPVARWQPRSETAVHGPAGAQGGGNSFPTVRQVVPSGLEAPQESSVPSIPGIVPEFQPEPRSPTPRTRPAAKRGGRRDRASDAIRSSCWSRFSDWPSPPWAFDATENQTEDAPVPGDTPRGSSGDTPRGRARPGSTGTVESRGGAGADQG